jgi:hypothetical protein
MQHEHCTFCGFMGLTRMETPGMKKCQRCSWEGYPDRSPMEEINKIAKGYRPGTKWAPPIKASLRAPVEGLDEIEGAGTPEFEEQEEHEGEEPVQQNLSSTPAQRDPRKDSFRMDDATANRSENFIDPNRKVSGKVPKNQELLDRLKGKNIRGADFL